MVASDTQDHGSSNAIQDMQAAIMRLRAEIIIRDTLIAALRDDHATLEASVPGLRKRTALAKTVQEQEQRIVALERERTQWQEWRTTTVERAQASVQTSSLAGAETGGEAVDEVVDGDFTAANRVICQVGCVGHNDYWRVDDHCKRDGRRCTLAAAVLPVAFVSAGTASSSADDES